MTDGISDDPEKDFRNAVYRLIHEMHYTKYGLIRIMDEVRKE